MADAVEPCCARLGRGGVEAGLGFGRLDRFGGGPGLEIQRFFNGVVFARHTVEGKTEGRARIEVVAHDHVHVLAIVEQSRNRIGLVDDKKR